MNCEDGINASLRNASILHSASAKGESHEALFNARFCKTHDERANMKRLNRPESG